MSARQALLLIDLQNDFCPGGALAVAEGDQTIAVANRLAAEFCARGEPVIATLDWHPAGTAVLPPRRVISPAPWVNCRVYPKCGGRITPSSTAQAPSCTLNWTAR